MAKSSAAARRRRWEVRHWRQRNSTLPVEGRHPPLCVGGGPLGILLSTSISDPSSLAVWSIIWRAGPLFLKFTCRNLGIAMVCRALPCFCARPGWEQSFHTHCRFRFCLSAPGRVREYSPKRLRCFRASATFASHVARTAAPSTGVTSLDICTVLPDVAESQTPVGHPSPESPPPLSFRASSLLPPVRGNASAQPVPSQLSRCHR